MHAFYHFALPNADAIVEHSTSPSLLLALGVIDGGEQVMAGEDGTVHASIHHTPKLPYYMAQREATATEQAEVLGCKLIPIPPAQSIDTS